MTGDPRKLMKAMRSKYATAQRFIVKRLTAEVVSMPLHDVFCVYPFMHVNIDVDGRIKLCCRSNRFLQLSETNGRRRDMSIYADTFPSIWNSEELRNVRSDIFMSRQVEDCVDCYEQERITGSSLRVMANAEYLPVMTGKGSTVDAMIAVLDRSHANQFYESPPLSYHLWVGSNCNQRCRMCSAQYSTSIQHDLVHSRWRPGYFPPPAHNRIGNMQWGESLSLLSKEILPESAKALRIVLSGGEPLINASVIDLIRRLASEPGCENVVLKITTNGSINPDQISRSLERFKMVDVLVSVDGFGALNDFIRYNSKWNNVSRNIFRFMALKNSHVTVCPTISVYNVFGLEELIAFCEKNKVEFMLENVLTEPSFLSIGALPPSIVSQLISHWNTVLRTVASASTKGKIEGLLRRMENYRDRHSKRDFKRFVRFNKEINRSHGTSISAANRQLYSILKNCEYRFDE